jgi:hypothetical protein
MPRYPESKLRARRATAEELKVLNLWQEKNSVAFKCNIYIVIVISDQQQLITNKKSYTATQLLNFLQF